VQLAYKHTLTFRSLLQLLATLYQVLKSSSRNLDTSRSILWTGRFMHMPQITTKCNLGKINATFCESSPTVQSQVQPTE